MSQSHFDLPLECSACAKEDGSPPQPLPRVPPWRHAAVQIGSSQCGRWTAKIPVLGNVPRSCQLVPLRRFENSSSEKETHHRLWLRPPLALQVPCNRRRQVTDRLPLPPAQCSFQVRPPLYHSA